MNVRSLLDINSTKKINNDNGERKAAAFLVEMQMPIGGSHLTCSAHEEREL